jgi:DNA-binding response OmpR family regulator
VHALIIEDQKLLSEIIENVLSECGFSTFDIASSSREAILAADRRRPALITADVVLAPGNGIQAVRLICPDLSTPVIFITGKIAAEVRTEISDYPVLHKPFSAQTLTYIVTALMREHVRPAAGPLAPV